MSHRYHYPINIPNEFNHWIDLYDPRFGPLDPHTITSEIAVPTRELVANNSKFYLWLKKLDIEVYALRMFRSLPNISYRLHVDVDPSATLATDKHIYDDVVKLNFIYHSQGSTMTWYNLKDGFGSYPSVNSSGYTSYNFHKEECDLVYHTDCDRACLIHGGRIHTLTNADNNGSPRLCYSMMIRKVSRQPLIWDQAVEILSPWLEH